MPPMLRPQTAIAVISDKLSEQGFNPQQDYIALTGPTLLVAYLLTAAREDYDPLKVLVFDAKHSQYIEAKVEDNDIDAIYSP